MITICLFTHKDYWITRYVVEKLLSSTFMELELLVFDNNNDKRTLDFLENLINSKEYPRLLTVGTIRDSLTNKAEAYNKLLKEAKWDYIAFLEANVLLSNNWLEDLFYYHKLIDNTGIASIRQQKEFVQFTSILDKNDEMSLVLRSKDNFINLPFILNKQIIQKFGVFEQKDNWLKDYCEKLSKEGYNNFYIPGQYLLKIE